MNELEIILQRVQTELDADFIATSVVGLDGMPIAAGAGDPKSDTSAMSARFALVMKLAGKLSDRLQLGLVDDNLVVTDQVLILSRFLGDGSYYWNMVVTKEATLGFVRVLMEEYADRLWAAIPGNA